jgi:23S rRNA pseudoU1915 N3-methylase RlmH
MQFIYTRIKTSRITTRSAAKVADPPKQKSQRLNSEVKKTSGHLMEIDYPVKRHQSARLAKRLTRPNDKATSLVSEKVSAFDQGVPGTTTPATTNDTPAFEEMNVSPTI